MSDLVEYYTKTSDWTLVIHAVSINSAELWFGSLSPTLIMPDKARLVLMDESKQVINSIQITKDEWQRPFSKIKKRFYAIKSFSDLTANTKYFVRFDRELPKSAGEYSGKWQDVCSAEFLTLPKELPKNGEGNFTVGLGSCFYSHRDGGSAASAYSSLYKLGPSEYRPDISFLVGDQVYLDIAMDSFSFDENEIWDRIAKHYEENWKLLGEIFRCGGSYFLPDDHEFWNDYPFYKTLIPALWPLRNSTVRKNATEASIEGIKNVQISKLVRIINIGSDISFCLADFRSERYESGFTTDAAFAEVCEWARNIKTPGVLVTSQNLMDSPGGSEMNLTDFNVQYKELVKALGSSGNTIISLSGDVHFGRIATATIGANSKLIEIVSSPLSNLTGLGGVATSVANKEPVSFANGVEINNANYDNTYFVSHLDADIIHGYPKVRTREHFMTIGFSKRSSGNIVLTVNAWSIRDVDENGLPKSDFNQPFVMDIT